MFCHANPATKRMLRLIQMQDRDALFTTVQQTIMEFPDRLLYCPAHSAGIACVATYTWRSPWGQCSGRPWFPSAVHWFASERGTCHEAAVQVICGLLVRFRTSQGKAKLLWRAIVRLDSERAHSLTPRAAGPLKWAMAATIQVTADVCISLWWCHL